MIPERGRGRAADPPRERIHLFSVWCPPPLHPRICGLFTSRTPWLRDAHGRLHVRRRRHRCRLPRQRPRPSLVQRTGPCAMHLVVPHAHQHTVTVILLIHPHGCTSQATPCLPLPRGCPREAALFTCCAGETGSLAKLLLALLRKGRTDTAPIIPHLLASVRGFPRHSLHHAPRLSPISSVRIPSPPPVFFLTLPRRDPGERAAASGGGGAASMRTCANRVRDRWVISVSLIFFAYACMQGPRICAAFRCGQGSEGLFLSLFPP